MSSSVALLPAPYSPPDRSGSRALVAYRPPARALRRQKLPTRSAEAEPDETGMAYSRKGRLLGDSQLGIWVDLYA